jgi:hypothetical protein
VNPTTEGQGGCSNPSDSHSIASARRVRQDNRADRYLQGCGRLAQIYALQRARAFDRRADSKALLLAPVDAEHLRDAETGSLWDFRGCAVEGPHASSKACITPVPVLWDYWFDWRAYNTSTTIYGR